MPTESRKRGRIRETNRAGEAKRFSTLRELRKDEKDRGLVGAVKQQPSKKQQKAAARGGSSAFDPILNDSVFFVVEDSKHWPPPPVEQLLQDRGAAPLLESSSALNDDFLDMFDRRDEDHPAAGVEKKKVVPQKPGELRVPRGVQRKSTKVTFDDDDDDADDGVDNE